jgi:hypothetical protein
MTLSIKINNDYTGLKDYFYLKIYDKNDKCVTSIGVLNKPCKYNCKLGKINTHPMGILYEEIYTENITKRVEIIENLFENIKFEDKFSYEYAFDIKYDEIKNNYGNKNIFDLFQYIISIYTSMTESDLIRIKIPFDFSDIKNIKNIVRVCKDNFTVSRILFEKVCDVCNLSHDICSNCRFCNNDNSEIVIKSISYKDCINSREMTIPYYNDFNVKKIPFIKLRDFITSYD